MTAPNDPTPEVEPVGWRWRSGFCGETIQDDWAWMISSVKPERQGNATDFQCEPLYPADAISRLTAERDVAREERQSSAREWRKAFDEMHQRAMTTEASNKLLSERVAVLEKENSRLRLIVSESASACGAHVSPECSIEFMSAVPNEITLALRRALAAREAK